MYDTCEEEFTLVLVLGICRKVHSLAFDLHLCRHEGCDQTGVVYDEASFRLEKSGQELEVLVGLNNGI